MPTVPRYQRQVAPQPLPSGALRAVDTPTSAGVGAAQARAAVGRGVVDIGTAVVSVGEKFLNIAYSARAKEMQEAKEYADQLAVLGASNKLDNWERQRLYDPQTGAFSQHGEQAFHLPETIAADFKKTADDIEFTLYTPEQKLAFAQMRSRRGQSIALDVERHVGAEMQKFAATELDAKKINTGDKAILKGGAGDFHAVGEALEEYATAVETIGKQLGMGPEDRAAESQQHRSAVHVGIVHQLVADGNMNLARVYFEETRDQIAGEARDDVTTLLKAGTAKKDAQVAADQIEADGGTFSEKLAKTKQIQDAETRDLTEQRLREADGDRQRARREVDEGRSKSISNILDTGAGIKAIDPRLWKDLEDTDKTRYRNYAESVANYGKGGAVKTDPHVFGALLTASKSRDPKTREAWLNVNLANEYINLLSASDLQEMQKLQANDREGKSDPTIFATEGVTNEVINGGLRKVGLDPGGDAAKLPENRTRIDAYRLAVRDAIDREHPPTLGKKPTRADIQSIVDTMSAEITPARDPWGPQNFPAVYGYNAPLGAQVTSLSQIPPTEIRRIEDAYRQLNQPYPPAAVIIREFNERMRTRRGGQ